MNELDNLRAYVKLPPDLIERMRKQVATGRYRSIDDLVEAALAGDPSTWGAHIMELSRGPQHNHPTREIRKPGVCPACDLYWAKRVTTQQRDEQRDRERGIEPQHPSPAVICLCCKPGPCQRQFRWRGLARCGCTGVGANPPGDAVTRRAGAGIVQADLDRQ